MGGRKRANGEGTIYKTGTGWRGQAFINGQRISRRGKTKQEVYDKLAEAVTDSNRGDFVSKNEITVREYAISYMRKHIEPRYTERTYLLYRRTFDNHIFPVFGDYRLQEVTTAILEEGYSRMFQKKLNGSSEGYARTTVNAVSSRFKKMFKTAVRDGLIKSNPHEYIRLHKMRPPKKIEAYSTEDQKKLLEYLKAADDRRQIFYFLVATGIRIGEATALTWDDVDFENKVISIDKIVVEVRGNPQIEERTKTEAGKRKVAVSSKVLEVLKRIKKSQDDELNFMNLVFPSNRYTIRTHSNLRLLWKSVCEEAGISFKRLHSLRHTWATRALESGINVKTVSVMLGHKDVITTMNIYQHVLVALQLESVEKMDDFL